MVLEDSAQVGLGTRRDRALADQHVVNTVIDHHVLLEHREVSRAARLNAIKRERQVHSSAVRKRLAEFREAQSAAVPERP